MERLPKTSKDTAKAVQQDKLVRGTGNLKHIAKKGLPPGIEEEDFFDPGSRTLEENADYIDDIEDLIENRDGS